MARPIILTVVLRHCLPSDHSRFPPRFADRHRIVGATSGAEALATLDELGQRDLSWRSSSRTIACPETAGIELLDRSRSITLGQAGPAYADVAIKAINDLGLDHYLTKPWAPPEGRLYPVLDDLLDEWDHANSRFEGVRVVRNRWSERSYDTTSRCGSRLRARGTGVDHLEMITLVDRSTGEEEEANANWSFVFSGALPRTDWLGDHVARDAHGFVLTGPDVAALDGEARRCRRAISRPDNRDREHPGHALAETRPHRSGARVRRNVSFVDVYAAELNQVWTNLIDNTHDAMDGEGTLRLTTSVDGVDVVIEIGDTAPASTPMCASACSNRSARPRTSARAPVSDSTSPPPPSSELGATTATVRLPIHR